MRVQIRLYIIIQYAADFVECLFSVILGKPRRVGGNRDDDMGVRLQQSGAAACFAALCPSCNFNPL